MDCIFGKYPDRSKKGGFMCPVCVPTFLKMNITAIFFVLVNLKLSTDGNHQLGSGLSQFIS